MIFSLMRYWIEKEGNEFVICKGLKGKLNTKPFAQKFPTFEDSKEFLINRLQDRRARLSRELSEVSNQIENALELKEGSK